MAVFYVAKKICRKCRSLILPPKRFFCTSSYGEWSNEECQSQVLADGRGSVVLGTGGFRWAKAMHHLQEGARA